MKSNKIMATKRANKVNAKRPSLFWLFTEGGRAMAEWGLSIPFRKLTNYENSGDGHPVLVIPGFMASDTSTKTLRCFLEEAGYAAHGWDLGRNLGKAEFLTALGNQLDELYALYGQKVSIIGWSLGGVFARQIAKRDPEKVRQVITLGSPFKGISQPNNVAWIYNILKGTKRVADITEELRQDLPNPAPVPTTAIYTKQDGIVPWQLCLEDEETAIHQNIEVRGSHLGLGHNPAVLRIIFDRLQYSAADWVHFQPSNPVESLVLYPSMT